MLPFQKPVSHGAGHAYDGVTGPILDESGCREVDSGISPRQSGRKDRIGGFCGMEGPEKPKTPECEHSGVWYLAETESAIV